MKQTLALTPTSSPVCPLIAIGIDGGGTHSLAVAVDSTGRTLAMAEAGSLNFFGAGLPTARRNLKKLVSLLRRRLRPGTKFSRIVVGCAALFSDATKPEAARLCRGLLPLGRTRVLSDCQTAGFGATLGRPGVVVIAGTGSIVLARNRAGQLTRVGGWGHVLGDAGSAYWIAVESVKAAIAAEEGLGPKTGLGRIIRRWFGAKTLTGIVPAIHRPEFAKEDLAALSGHLARSAGRSDGVFRSICWRAGRELAAQARTALRRARLERRLPAVWLIGGVLTNNTLVRASLLAALKESCVIRLEAPRLPPVLGAAAMALVDSGAELTPEIVANLAAPTRPCPHAAVLHASGWRQRLGRAQFSS